MKQITIDFKNDFDCSKKEKSKACRSGYVRLVRFMDDKKHTRPQVYEGDLLEAIMDVKEGECQELRYIGGYDELSGSLDMSIKCLVKK